jgi:hypothetical protein
MRLSGFVCALAFAILICSASIARAQDCTCAGRPMGTPYAGGNGQPLKWLYSPHIMSSPPPPAQQLICYFKQVSNKSDAAVRDVRWEVANFFRRIVPKGASPSSCPQIAGETKPTPTNGPLYFGPSSEAYDTTVLQPKDGWGANASNSSAPIARDNQVLVRKRNEDGAYVVEILNARKLETTITFYVDDQQGKPVPARLVFDTEVAPDRDKTHFTYTVANESEVTLAVRVNLSATSSLLERVPMLQRPLWMKPRQRIAFEVSAEGQDSIEQAAIVVYDVNKNISAIDSAAFHTVPGKKEVSDESFWKLVH